MACGVVEFVSEWQRIIANEDYVQQRFVAAKVEKKTAPCFIFTLTFLVIGLRSQRIKWQTEHLNICLRFIARACPHLIGISHNGNDSFSSIYYIHIGFGGHIATLDCEIEEFPHKKPKTHLFFPSFIHFSI